MVHSASITSWPTEAEQVYLSRHLIFLVLGAGAGTVCALLPIRFWRNAAPWLFAATLVLLVAVLLPGIGTEVNGARRWLRFGSFSLQPCELAKLAVPLLLAKLLEQRLENDRRAENERRTREAGDRRKPSFFGILGAPFAKFGSIGLLWPLVLVVPLVVLQPDLGSALFIAGGGAIALFAGGWPLRNFIFASLAAVPACWSFLALEPYQLRRIRGFLAVWTDWSEAPYQLKQSLMALGTGGLSGVGLGRGWQKLSFLPEANTDFVVAVVGEELGLIGTLSLSAVWIAFYLSGLRLLGRLEHNTFAWTAGFTLLTQLVLQAAINVAVVTAMVPPKGIPHPFISYGGSNLVVSLAALGIIVSLAEGERSDAQAQRL